MMKVNKPAVFDEEGLAATGRAATGLAAATGRAATVVGGGALTSPLRVGEVAVMGIRKSESDTCAPFINNSGYMDHVCPG